MVQRRAGWRERPYVRATVGGAVSALAQTVSLVPFEARDSRSERQGGAESNRARTGGASVAQGVPEGEESEPERDQGLQKGETKRAAQAAACLAGICIDGGRAAHAPSPPLAAVQGSRIPILTASHAVWA